MSEERYAAMREYIRLAVELEGNKIKQELRSALPAETRAVEPNIEEIERRVWEKIEPKLPVVPKIITEKGDKGDDGEPGKDGIATREEIESVVERKVADVRVRTFADMYQGVWEPARDYTRSQAVTWGGGVYLALADTKGKPAESSDWRVIVKPGRDARK